MLAIGNPFGLDHTLTTGIVSALNRTVDNELGGAIENVIQTDAAINPGNSGGPLIDSAGRLVGINTMIYSPSGAYAGIGFAVPVDTINRVVPRLIGYGRYVRPTLGISANDDVSQRLLDGDDDGVLVLGVTAGSPAARAGLRATEMTASGRVTIGDVIEAVDGRSVENFADARQRARRARVRRSHHADGAPRRAARRGADHARIGGRFAHPVITLLGGRPCRGAGR